MVRKGDESVMRQPAKLAVDANCLFDYVPASSKGAYQSPIKAL